MNDDVVMRQYKDLMTWKEKIVWNIKTSEKFTGFVIWLA